MSISVSPSIKPLQANDLLPERLARTVCEIDPDPRSPFAVAVVLEVIGHNDQTARKAGRPNIFALAQEIYSRIEFLKDDGHAEEPGERGLPRLDVPSALSAAVAQHAVWLLMVLLMIIWGRSVWSAERFPLDVAQALIVGILGSLVVSGGFQYAITRRLLFHIAQRDMAQARAFLHRAVWLSGLVMSAGACLIGLGFWATGHGDRLAPLLAAGYFLLHGNYRVAVIPLIALNDVAGIVLSAGAGIALLALTYEHLNRSGMDGTLAVAAAQFAGLAALWLGSVVRSRWLLGAGAPMGGASGPGIPVTGQRDRLSNVRWPVLYLDAVPWFATGVLYYLFLFGMRPIVWMLPPTERQVYESGVDLGMLGIIPVAIVASWGLRRFYLRLREQLSTITVLNVTALRAQAATRLSQMIWRCRWFGAVTAVLLLKVTEGAHWGGLSDSAVAVFRLTLVGTVAVLPTFLLSFGLLTTLGALGDAVGVLAGGLALQVGWGLSVVRLGTAGWLALTFVASATVLGELARWRAHHAVRNIDRFYYAAF